MPMNYGYVGVGRESTPGTAVSPTIFFVAESPAEVRANVEFVEITPFDGFGPTAVIPSARSGQGRIEGPVTPKAIGAVFAALLGLPTTSGTAPNYQHVFTPKTSIPTYTVEAQDGVAIHRLVGAQVSTVELSHGTNDILRASVEWVAMDRTTTGTPATPSTEATYFTVGQATLSIGGTNVQGRAENVSVSLSFPKTPFQSLGQIPASQMHLEGTGEVTAQLDLVYDSTGDSGRLADYLNGTIRPVSLAWAVGANTSLTIAFDAAITVDPAAVSNRDVGMARIRLELKAVRTGSNLVTITLKNSQASY